MPNNHNVDERVVEMRIDNKKFESGAKKTISTLEKLEKALHLKSDTSAIDNMERAVNKFDASPMSSAIDKVSSHFSALEIAGMRVISNLTDSIYNFATKTVKALTIDQVSEGWNKYEKMIESTQTIMAATQNMIGRDTLADGTKAILDEAGAYRDLDGALVGFLDRASQMTVVQDYLDGLLWFADETSYSFTDMTDNLGKFLSAGVDLDKAYLSMMGVASWGATAGAKPAEVSRALYNISQAMGSGAMKNIDWRSIENANMATLGFKQTAIEIAEEMGKLQAVTNDVDEGFVAVGVEVDDTGHIVGKTNEEVEKMLITAENFRDSLSSGWFDSEVMEEVFARYGMFAEQLRTAVDETGLEATEVLQILDKSIKQGAKFDWEKYAKSAHMTAEELQGIVEALDAIGIAYDYSEQGFRRGQEAKTFTDAIEATKDAVSSRWMKTFQYIFGDYLEATQFWTQVTTELYDMFAAGGDVRNEVLEAWAEVDEFGRSGRDYLLGIEYDDEGEIAFQGALWNLLDAVKTITSPISEAFAEVFGLDNTQQLGYNLRELTKRIQEFTEECGLSEEAQEGLKSVFKVVFGLLKDGVKITAKAVEVFGQLALAFRDLLAGDISFTEFIQRAIDSFSELGTTVKDIFKNLLQSIRPSEDELLAFWENLKTKVKGFKDYLLTGQLFKDIGGFIPSLTDISGLVTKIGTYLETNYPKIFAKFEEWKEKSLLGTIFSTALTDIQTFYTTVSGWLSNLSIDTEGLTEIFDKFSEVVSFLFGSLFGDPEELKAKITEFFTTVKDSLKEQFGNLTLNDYLKMIRTAGLTALLAEIGQILAGFKRTVREFQGIPQAFQGLMNSAGKMFEDIGKSYRATAILKIAAAVGILALALWGLTKLDQEKLTHAAVIIAMLIGVLTLLANKLGGINKIIGGDTGNFSNNKITVFSSFSSALLGIAAVIASLAGLYLVVRKMKFDELIVVFAGVLGLILMLRWVTKSLAEVEFKNPGGVIGSILAVSVALDLMLPVFAAFALMPFTRYLQAVIGVAGLLAVFTGLAIWMSKVQVDGQRIVRVAGSMALMAVALDLLIPILAVLAAISPTAFGRGFAGLLGVMVLLGGLAAVLGKLKIDGKNLLAVAAAMALMALAVDLMIPAIAAFSAVITGVLLAVDWDKVTKKLGSFGDSFLKVIGILAAAAVIAAIVYAVGKGIFYLGAGLALAAAAALLLAIALPPLGEAIPKFVEALQKMDTMSLKDMLKNFGKVAIVFVAFAAAVAALVWGLGKLTGGGLLKKVGGLGTSLVGSLGSLGAKFSAKIVEMMPTILQLLGGLLIMAGLYFMGIIPDLVEILVNSVITLFNSLADSVEAHKDELVDSITRIIMTALDVVTSVIEDIFSHWDDMSLVEKCLLGFGTFTVATDGILTLAGHFSQLWNAIGSGGKGGAAAGSGLSGALRDVWAAIQLFAETSAGAATLGVGGIVLGSGIYAGVSIARTEAQYTKEAFDGLGESANDYAVAAQRLQTDINTLNTDLANLNQWGADTSMTEAALSEKTHVLNQVYADLATQLGITKEELLAQIAAADGDITQIAALKAFNEQLAAAERDAAAAASQQTQAQNELAESGTVTAESWRVKWEELKASFLETPSVIYNTQEEFTAAASSVGQGGATEFVNGFLGQLTDSQVESLMSDAGMGSLFQTFLGAQESTDANAGTVGGNAAAGIINGLLSSGMLDSLFSAGETAGETIYEGAKHGLRSRSPSRRMAEVGMYAALGLVNGLMDEESSVFSAGDSLGAGLTDAVKESMAGIALLANEDFSISPLITPVVDMSNVDYAASAIDGSFSGGSYSLSGQIGSSIARRLAQAERIASQAETRGSMVNSNDNITFNIYAAEGMDENAIADAVMDRMGSRYARRGVAYG